MRSLGLIFLCILFSGCQGQQTVEEKINGVSFVATRDAVGPEHLGPVEQLHANYAAIMPFAFIRSVDEPTVIFNRERQWFGETEEGVKQYTKELHSKGIKVMLKPQIWIRNGEFTGEFKPNTEAQWLALEKSYSDFILTFAKVAQESKVDIFCIGTELHRFVENRPEYWHNLVTQVKQQYKGKLTYAANWDEYTKTPFWKDLDYIGIDGYFPLSEEKSPKKEDLVKGWQKWKDQMQKLHVALDKPILFTEFGYRSMDYTAKKPWLVDRNQENVNLDAQALALQVVFDELWKEEWFAGGFIWKWFPHHNEVGGKENNRFTPQNKPAEETIRQHYKNQLENQG
ncbi:glycoside hydrolase [Croceivirga radicis]|uniref:Glycoside hydrolase n=1 Tax=Croceivirga radicis TaxID=1929488 RepID=A0A1V6LRD7_9FLAO|nr:glycoside hydrolase TIM-barrel-like domain-containing protein [Croceivirga radicis]OQD42526.1 glycoside hydrolase [Croceivirga radicis]